jgi:hypothetical protein
MALGGKNIARKNKQTNKKQIRKRKNESKRIIFEEPVIGQM